MERDRHEKVSELFAATYQMAPEERAAHLDEACGVDDELRREVEDLLARDMDRRPFMDESVLGPDFKLQDPDRIAELDASLEGQPVGRYTLKRLIAVGGMGTVYEAEQESPHRTVALKILRRGIASSSALHRFEYESDILARLRHDGIAQVYDAGTHPVGGESVPYFAMELVPGAQPLTEYGREHKLGIADRLRLFVTVCDAVHHGHQKGVIHRDLKPANILVDSSGRPKIIDFGVARATDSDLAITTMHSDVGQIVGTLQYMSPEQCLADPHGIDIRSDVYALGVVLYEVLCDRLPYTVTKAAVHEAIQVIRDSAPTKPSTIDRALRGDLETITLKALEKDPQRRYQSAAELGQEIRRYLNDEPIVARPPSAIYHLRKFARRNRTLVAALAALVVALVAGTATSMTLAIRATREAESRAIAQEHAETVTELLQEMLSNADPGHVEGLRRLLDEFSARLAERLADQPLIETAVRTTIGNVYRVLGEYDKAEANLTQAVEIRRRMLGDDHPETLRSRHGLASVHQVQGRLPQAETQQLEILEGMRRVLGENHPDTLSIMGALAETYRRQGRLDEAEEVFIRTLDLQRQIDGAEAAATLITLNNLAICHDNQGRFDEAEREYLGLLETRRRVLGQEHHHTLDVMNSLGALYIKLGRYGDAEPLLLEALETQRMTLGEDHPHALSTMNTLGALYSRLERYDEAEQLFTTAVEVLRRIHGREHPQPLATAGNLAKLYIRQGRDEEAHPVLVEVLEAQRKVLGEDHPHTIVTISELARLAERRGQYADAEALFVEALALHRRRFGEEHPSTLALKSNLGRLYTGMGRYKDAEPLLTTALAGARRIFGEEHPGTLALMRNLGALYVAQGRNAEAQPLLAAAADTASRVLPEGHWRRGDILTILGSCLSGLGQYEQAEAALLEAHAILEAAPGDHHDRVSKARSALIDLYIAWGKPEKADEWRAKLEETSGTERPTTNVDADGS